VAGPLVVPVVDEGLGNSAYLADLGDGRALAVDVPRDLRAVRAAADRHELKIAFGADTHLHADFLSGAVQLAADDGAQILASASGGRAFGHRGLADGDEVDLGGLTLRAWVTPGHTAEHLVYLLLDGGQYLAVLAGHPAKFPPGERFSYCNSGYVVLALIAERISGVAFDQLVAERLCGPAGMADTGFLRSDELPDRTALGYLPVPGRSRTNVFHLPVWGSGDGGIYSTAADISALWQSLFTGRIVPARWVAEMVRPRSDVPGESKRYGLGFWLGQHSDTVILEGFDAGVSFRSVHDPRSAVTCTVISNSSGGAWPIARRLDEFLAG
jgi:hypothetical protein